MWKDFLYFPRQQKQGLLLLIILLIILVVANLGIDSLSSSEKVSIDNDPQTKAKYEEFVASIKRKKKEFTKKRGINKQVFTLKTENLSFFDPNKADSLTFTSLGMPQWMTHNILKYRAKGGVFRTKESFQKVYGLSEENYQKLLPFLVIDLPKRDYTSKKSLIDSTLIDTSKIVPRKELKYSKVTPINLNTTDTTTLKRIPGIGSYIANLIINYKNRLGGFYSIKQLKEIHLKADSLKEWFVIEEEDIQKMNINRCSLNRLRAHPYLNFYQAKAIIEYRKRKGDIKDLKVFRLYDEFKPQDFERLSHYVCYE